MNRTTELLQRWQDGGLSEDEIRELKDILRTSEGRREVVQEFETIAAITEEFRNAVEARKSGLAALDVTSGSVHSPPSGGGQGGDDSRESRRTTRAAGVLPWCSLANFRTLGSVHQIAAVIAFGILCLLGVTKFWRGQPWQAKLARVDGEVEIIRESKSVPAAVGMELRNGDEIRAAHGAEAVVQYDNEATFFRLAQNSSVRLFGSNQRKRVEFIRGDLEAEVAPQPRFHPMVVITPQAKTTMLGTRFLLHATAEATKLDVIEGLVRMNGHDSEESIDVSTAHSAEAASSLELRAVAQDTIIMNFGPEGVSLPLGVLNDSGLEFDERRGYGWEGPKEAGVIPGEFTEFRGRLTPAPRGRNAGIRSALMGGVDALHASHVQAGWLNYTQSWKMKLAPGRYSVTVCAGDSASPQGPLHVNVQGQQVIDGVFTRQGEFAEVRDVPVVVNEDGFLKLLVGGHRGEKRMPDGSSDTTLNFIVVKSVKDGNRSP